MSRNTSASFLSLPSAFVACGAPGVAAWSLQYALADISNILLSKKQKAIGFFKVKLLCFFTKRNNLFPAIPDYL